MHLMLIYHQIMNWYLHDNFFIFLQLYCFFIYVCSVVLQITEIDVLEL